MQFKTKQNNNVVDFEGLLEKKIWKVSGLQGLKGGGI